MNRMHTVSCVIFFIFFTSISCFADGWVDVSALSINDSDESGEVVTLDLGFSIEFSLAEYNGESKSFEYIQVVIQDENGNDLYVAKTWDEGVDVNFAPNEEKNYTCVTYLDSSKGRRPGVYRALVEGKIAGESDTFPLGIIGGSSAENPLSFVAEYPKGWIGFQHSETEVISPDKCNNKSEEYILLSSEVKFSITIKEHWDGYVILEFIRFVVTDSYNNSFIMQSWENQVITPGETRSYSDSNYLIPLILSGDHVTFEWEARKEGGDTFNLSQGVAAVRPCKTTSIADIIGAVLRSKIVRFKASFNRRISSIKDFASDPSDDELWKISREYLCELIGIIAEDGGHFAIKSLAKNGKAFTRINEYLLGHELIGAAGKFSEFIGHAVMLINGLIESYEYLGELYNKPLKELTMEEWAVVMADIGMLGGNVITQPGRELGHALVDFAFRDAEGDVDREMKEELHAAIDEWRLDGDEIVRIID